MTTLLLSATRLSLKLPSNTTLQVKPLGPLHPFPGLNAGGKKQSTKLLFASFSVKCQSVSDTSQRFQGKNRMRKPILSEGRDEDEKFGDVCPGCGVFMQDKDPNLPGYYKERKSTETKFSADEDDIDGEFDEFDGDLEASMDDSDGELEESDEVEDVFKWDDAGELEARLMEEEEDDAELDGFAPVGVGYGNITEETIEKAGKKKVSKSEKKRIAREAQKEKEEVTVCARCHSLRNYGQVKNQAAENLIPDFDFNRLIATRLMKPTSNSNTTVVVMVVDCVDFEGSFPKRAAQSLFKALEESKMDSKLCKRLPKLVLVATKVDLLPSQVSPTRLDKWVRHRARASGCPKLTGVNMVSSRKDMGVRNLLSFIKELAGPRGNVWVIGAQNAGKSTLINALAKKEGAKVMKLTEAPVPGTTLGILRIGGILSAKAKLFDTPGLLHPYLVSMRLNREEQKMVEIRKELQPRTYRMKVGQAIHVGGLMRLDLNNASVDTIYVTVWSSPNISLHMGKIENSDEMWKKHVGVRLQPPIGQDRVSELGQWKEREVKVSGTSWDVNSIDIAAAGLGWFSIGLKGEATLSLWIYDGIEISVREPLVLDRAPFLERPGFWLPKAISDAIASESNLEAQRRKKIQDSADSLLEVSA